MPIDFRFLGSWPLHKKMSNNKGFLTNWPPRGRKTWRFSRNLRGSVTLKITFMNFLIIFFLFVWFWSSSEEGPIEGGKQTTETYFCSALLTPKRIYRFHFVSEIIYYIFFHFMVAHFSSLTLSLSSFPLWNNRRRYSVAFSCHFRTRFFFNKYDECDIHCFTHTWTMRKFRLQNPFFRSIHMTWVKRAELT